MRFATTQKANNAFFVHKRLKLTNLVEVLKNTLALSGGWWGGGRPLNSCLVLEPSSSLGLKHLGQSIHLYHLLCLSRHQYFLLRHEEQPLTMPLDASSSDQSTPNGWSIDRVPLLLP